MAMGRRASRSSLSDDEIVESGKQLAAACRSPRRCLTVPVEPDINEMLEQAGLDRLGAVDAL
jgi:hypothetical protein